MLALQPERAALLLIDMQRDFCAPGGYAEHAGLDIQRLRAPIAAQQALLAAARASGTFCSSTTQTVICSNSCAIYSTTLHSFQRTCHVIEGSFEELSG